MAPLPHPIDIGQAATASGPPRLASRLMPAIGMPAPSGGALLDRLTSPITGRAHRKRPKAKRATLPVPRSWPLGARPPLPTSRWTIVIEAARTTSGLAPMPCRAVFPAFDHPLSLLDRSTARSHASCGSAANERVRQHDGGLRVVASISHRPSEVRP